MGVTNCRSSAYSVDTEFPKGKQCCVLLAASTLTGRVKRPVRGWAGRVAGVVITVAGPVARLAEPGLVGDRAFGSSVCCHLRRWPEVQSVR